MDDVFLIAGCEVAADSAGERFAAIGGAGHETHNIDGVLAFETHHDDR